MYKVYIECQMLIQQTINSEIHWEHVRLYDVRRIALYSVFERTNASLSVGERNRLHKHM